ncbi:hypothetical protein QFZ36_002959 [Pseudarthrobacter siccitolerans]|uniref:Secreted protein n=1 Tax=Pseudarthrobacter siccitolerans TaxID=861266 RepID=A0ABU0PN38_9MICC|nr:hypothetical protein [Pseudarthrobacter siccitolerans]
MLTAASPLTIRAMPSEGAGVICVACVRATKEQQAANGAGAGAYQPRKRTQVWVAFRFVIWGTVGVESGHG